MAISRVQSKTATTNSGATLAITLDSTPTAGNIVILAIGANGSCQITPGGNIEWVMIPWLQSTSRIGVLAIGRVLASPSATITVTNGATNAISIVAAEYSGVGLIALDRTQVASAATGTALASGASGTTTSANELWVGCLFSGAARPTSGTFFTVPTNSFAIVAETQSTLNASSDRTVALTERIVTSTGTANTGATAAISGVWVAIVATLQESASGGASSGCFIGGF